MFSWGKSRLCGHNNSFSTWRVPSTRSCGKRLHTCVYRSGPLSQSTFLSSCPALLPCPHIHLSAASAPQCHSTQFQPTCLSVRLSTLTARVDRTGMTCRGRSPEARVQTRRSRVRFDGAAHEEANQQTQLPKASASSCLALSCTDEESVTSEVPGGEHGGGGADGRHVVFA